MLSAACPCCGAKIDFRYEDVLIKCPACEIRFSYEEIMNKPPQQDEKEKEKELHNIKLNNWKKISRSLLAVISLLHFFSWFMIFITDANGATGVMILFTWTVALFGVPIVSSLYPPDDDIDMAKNQKAVTTGEVCIKLGAITLALCIITFLLAVFADEFIEMFL